MQQRDWIPGAESHFCSTEYDLTCASVHDVHVKKLTSVVRVPRKGNRDNFTKSLQASTHCELFVHLPRSECSFDSPCAVLEVPHFELQGKVLGLIGGSGGIGSKADQKREVVGDRPLMISPDHPRSGGSSCRGDWHEGGAC